AGTASSAEGRRLPTLRRSSVRGSQSASGLSRGRSRLSAGRSMESLDAKKTRNESRGGRHDSFRNLLRHSLILCCLRSVGQLVTPIATWVSYHPGCVHCADARAGLSTGPSLNRCRRIDRLAAGAPCGHGSFREPECQASPPHQSGVVLGPIGHPISRLGKLVTTAFVELVRHGLPERR